MGEKNLGQVKPITMGGEKHTSEAEFKLFFEELQKTVIQELVGEYNGLLHQTNMELSGVEKDLKSLRVREESLVANKERLEGALGAFADLKEKVIPQEKA